MLNVSMCKQVTILLSDVMEKFGKPRNHEFKEVRSFSDEKETYRYLWVSLPDGVPTSGVENTLHLIRRVLRL